MYSILFENNVTIVHLVKELTMKKYFKFVSSILTATILISILYPNLEMNLLMVKLMLDTRVKKQQLHYQLTHTLELILQQIGKQFQLLQV